MVPTLGDGPRFQLLRDRMRLLIQKGICKPTKAGNEFFISGGGERDSFEEVMKEIDPREQLLNNMNSPYVVFMFARRILDAFSAGNEDFGSALKYLLENDAEPTFMDDIKEADKWSITKSLKDVFSNQDSIEYGIMKTLYIKKEGRKLLELSGDLNETVKKVSNSVQQILFGGELIHRWKVAGMSLQKGPEV